MFHRIFVFTFIASLFLFQGAYSAEKYSVDPVHSRITFSVRHMMLSNVSGEFKTYSGAITHDAKDATKLTASGVIKVASLDTGNADRDKHLRGTEFFDADKYPEIVFQGKQVKKSGKDYVMIGTLTMHGVSKDVKIPFQIMGKVKDPWGKERLGLQARLTINRRDFGIAFNKTLDNGGLMVGNEVTIDLNVEGVKD
ncbi:MAG: YceI family protein [Armatimonadetes bacterium]|nr:YceI family protein [Armatimonadota bacterium]